MYAKEKLMNKYYKILDKSDKIMRDGNFTEPEIRMVAKAGFRVFESNDNEITPELTGLFENHLED